MESGNSALECVGFSLRSRTFSQFASLYLVRLQIYPCLTEKKIYFSTNACITHMGSNTCPAFELFEELINIFFILYLRTDVNNI